MSSLGSTRSRNCQHYGEWWFTGCICCRLVHALLYPWKILLSVCAGCAVSWDGEFNEYIEGEVFASAIDLLLNCACFVYIGAWIPFNSFSLPDLGIEPWRLVVLTCGIMILRRIPALLLLYRWIPEIDSWRQALFSGHFGTCIVDTDPCMIDWSFP